MPKGVHILMSAAEGQVVQAWLRANKGPQQYLQTMKEITGQSQRAGSAGAGSFNRMTQQAGRFAASLFGIGSAFQAASTAIGAIRREFEQLKQVRQSAAEVTVEVGEAVNRIRGLLPPGADISADEIGQRVSTMDTPVGQRERFQVVETAITAGIEASTAGQRAFDFGQKTIELLGKFIPGNAEALSEFARAAVAVERRFPDRSPEEIILGLFQGLVAGPGGFENAEEFSKNAVQAVNILGMRDFTFRQAMGMVAGLQTAALDTDAASVRTTLLNLVETLDKFVPVELRGTGSRALEFLRAEGEFAGDPEAIRANRELLRSASDELAQLARDQGRSIEEVLRNLDVDGTVDSQVRARARTRAFIVELLQPEGFGEGPGTTKSLVRSAEQNILEGVAAIEDFNQRLAEGSRSRIQAPFEIEMASKAFLNRLNARTDVGARGVVENLISEALPRLGETAAKTSLERTLTAVRVTGQPLEGSLQVAIESLTGVLTRMLSPEFVSAGPGGRGVAVPRERDEQDIAILRDMVATLQQIRDSLPKNPPINPPADPPSRSAAAQLQQP